MESDKVDEIIVSKSSTEIVGADTVIVVGDECKINSFPSLVVNCQNRVNSLLDPP